ncbi:MAG: amidase family protein [Deltaproteobacteria bacterium]|nr:amidase family protein [Deltaproteobacteria bacterium]
MKWIFGASDHTIPALILTILELFPDLTPRRAERFVEEGRQLKQDLVDAIGENGVMLYPPYTAPAPRHHWPVIARTFHWVYTAILNMMEVPATQVPLGLNDEGLPLGVQVVAAHDNDHLCVAVAMELERAMGGWVPPRLGSWD